MILQYEKATFFWTNFWIVFFAIWGEFSRARTPPKSPIFEQKSILIFQKLNVGQKWILGCIWGAFLMNFGGFGGQNSMFLDAKSNEKNEKKVAQTRKSFSRCPCWFVKANAFRGTFWMHFGCILVILDIKITCNKR